MSALMLLQNVKIVGLKNFATTTRIHLCTVVFHLLLITTFNAFRRGQILVLLTSWLYQVCNENNSALAKFILSRITGNYLIYSTIHVKCVCYVYRLLNSIAQQQNQQHTLVEILDRKKGNVTFDATTYKGVRASTVIKLKVWKF